MSSPGHLPPEVLRRRYAQMHQQLQAAGTRIIKLEERIAILETENAELKRHPENTDA